MPSFASARVLDALRSRRLLPARDRPAGMTCDVERTTIMRQVRGASGRHRCDRASIAHRLSSIRSPQFRKLLTTGSSAHSSVKAEFRVPRIRLSLGSPLVAGRAEIGTSLTPLTKTNPHLDPAAVLCASPIWTEWRCASTFFGEGAVLFVLFCADEMPAGLVLPGLLYKNNTLTSRTSPATRGSGPLVV